MANGPGLLTPRQVLNNLSVLCVPEQFQAAPVGKALKRTSSFIVADLRMHNPRELRGAARVIVTRVVIVQAQRASATVGGV